MVIPTEVQYVSDAKGKPVSVLVPITLWSEIVSARETAYLFHNETMQRHLLEVKERTKSISLKDVRKKLGV